MILVPVPTISPAVQPAPVFLPGAGKASAPSKPAVTDPTQIDLSEKPKQIGFGDEKRELRKLTPEEKAKRRLIRNIVWLTIGLVLLIVMTAILLRVR